MKLFLRAVAVLISGGITGFGQTTPGAVPTPAAASQGSYSIVGQDGNSRRWQREEIETGPDGQTYVHTHHITELASGLNFLGSDGNWTPAVEQILIQPDGSAAATQGQHKVHFPANILAGDIELTLPDGSPLDSQPAALAYYDGSKTAFIAVLTRSVGQVSGANQMIYANAFDGLKADLVYTYTKAGLEQDVVLRQRPPLPGELGLNPATTRLQVLTEFFGGVQPGISGNVALHQAGMTLQDEQLAFGTMRMVPGKAFALSGGPASVSVSKSWMVAGGRRFLVEEASYAALAPQLQSLSASMQRPGHRLWAMANGGKAVLPPRRHLQKTAAATVSLASGRLPGSGVVLDYQIVGGGVTNFVFCSDTTYYVSGPLQLNGTNIFEGGTVLKYATNASLSASAPAQIECQTAAYRPAVFTAKDDNSVGETISGSTGNPTNYYANPAISYTSTGSGTLNLDHIRICHALSAVYATAPGLQVLLADSQIYDCETGFTTPGQTGAALENDLFANVLVPLSLYLANVTAINVTFVGQAPDPANNYNSAFLLTPAGTGPEFNVYVTLTNCILANFVLYSAAGSGLSVTGADNGFYNDGLAAFGPASVTSTEYPFVSVGGGGFYLASTSPFHSAGTAGLDPALLADLSGSTTYPPIAFTNTSFTTATAFSPQAMRDTGPAPDLGYHYNPLDFTFGGCTAYNNLTFGPGTAVGWFRTSAGWYHAGDGIQMSGNVNVGFNGTATLPDYWVRLNTVQESDTTAGYGHGGIENWAGPDVPVVSGSFLKCSVLAGEVMNGFFDDDWGLITSQMTDCEFYSGAQLTYGDYMYFTNCLMRRVLVGLANGGPGYVSLFRNCTFVGGRFLIGRQPGGTSLVSVRDTAFDGTAISTADYYGGNPAYSDYDYNAYSNSVDPFSLGGTNDVKGVLTFNWQSSWFGDNYLPSNSPLLMKGSTNANFVGLYHFTTQTNQTPEEDAVVDIGYHYVAANLSGNPLDTNGDGIPDYLEDANGNGVVDSGEIGWNISNDPGLSVLITMP